MSYANGNPCQHVYESHDHDMVCEKCGKIMTYDEYERAWRDLGGKAEEGR